MSAPIEAKVSGPFASLSVACQSIAFSMPVSDSCLRCWSLSAQSSTVSLSDNKSWQAHAFQFPNGVSALIAEDFQLSGSVSFRPQNSGKGVM